MQLSITIQNISGRIRMFAYNWNIRTKIKPSHNENNKLNDAYQMVVRDYITNL